MRQAGRYLPSYRKIRRGRTILEIAKSPELSSSVAVDAARTLGVDAAILFADIMLPLEGIGIKFRIEENVGPIISNPIRSSEDVEGLARFSAKAHVPYVLAGIERTLEKLNDSMPVIGFSGGPFTLASYIIEGAPSRDFTLTKRMMYEQPRVWHRLMRRLASLVADYLDAQVRQGVGVVQLFDSWAGCLSREDYERSVLEFSKSVFDSLPSRVPKIHFCADSSALIAQFLGTGCDVVSLDWRIPIDEVWRSGGDDVSAQGNLDPVVAVAGGGVMERQVLDILKRADGHRGHIFNLGHGVLRETPPENLRRVVAIVHQKTKAKR